VHRGVRRVEQGPPLLGLGVGEKFRPCVEGRTVSR
jgi:hypothetical protein